MKHLREELVQPSSLVASSKVVGGLTLYEGREHRVEERLVDNHLLSVGVVDSNLSLGVSSSVVRLFFVVIGEAIERKIHQFVLLIEMGSFYGCQVE